jgi:AcrR family transcriptional regulator
VASQERRRAETRGRLLDAAADLFAERGIDGSSIDAIAEAADRTSGAVYDHFGGKQGLLFALLQRWLDDVAVVIDAEVATARNLTPKRPSTCPTATGRRGRPSSRRRAGGRAPTPSPARGRRSRAPCSAWR